ncbi:tyrosine-type recombinase/integrase [Pseudomonas kurunegalensis]|uniref:tyrosine-type recombinase/integrase n=1 Tax=Pseudomonas kurunegalensis TaxID=485880 RepID=UPI0023640347|nr:integrase arm-type DNA-binding domain-containing protein [Pseudomonas kurunegalensis]MDD2135645.1 site-specific integrase [Pseudomonas kurunegalensis]
MPHSVKQQANSDAAARGITTPGKYTEGSVPGVFLHVTETAKVWRLRYRLHGVGGLFTIGKFPDIGHARACQLGQEARTLVAEGIKPLTAKKERIAAQREKEQWTFQRVADLWLIYKSKKAAKTQAGYRSVLNNHILPRFADVPVDRLQYMQVRDLILGLAEYRSMAKKAHSVVREILDYGIDLGVLKENIADRRIKLVDAPETVHHAAIENPDDLKEFIRRLNDTNSSTIVSGLWLMVLLAVRSNELVNMRWEQLDLDKGEWRYHMTKVGKDHIVFLPTQAVGQLNLLKERQQARRIAQVPTPFGSGGRTPVEPVLTGWVLPSSQKAGRPIASISLLRQIRAMGYKQGELTTHGFRATFVSLGEEQLGVPQHVLDACIGHKRKDTGSLRGAYARSPLLAQRREAMQKWADYIERLWYEVVHGIEQG